MLNLFVDIISYVFDHRKMYRNKIIDDESKKFQVIDLRSDTMVSSKIFDKFIQVLLLSLIRISLNWQIIALLNDLNSRHHLLGCSNA